MLTLDFLHSPMYMQMEPDEQSGFDLVPFLSGLLLNDTLNVRFLFAQWIKTGQKVNHNLINRIAIRKRVLSCIFH